jgi:hypothetical protein
LVKSFSDTQPDLGLASEPVDVQRYVDGRVHEPPGDCDGDDGGAGDDGGGGDDAGPPTESTCHRWLGWPWQS